MSFNEGASTNMGTPVTGEQRSNIYNWALQAFSNYLPKEYLTTTTDSKGKMVQSLRMPQYQAPRYVDPGAQFVRPKYTGQPGGGFSTFLKARDDSEPERGATGSGFGWTVDENGSPIKRLINPIATIVR